MPEEVMERLLPDGIGPSAEVEKATLREMQLLLRRRTTSTALAIGSAALAFACLPESDAQAIEVLRKGGVWLAAGFCLASLLSIWRFLKATERLRDLGVRRARGVRPRWSWELAGIFVSLAVVSTLCAALDWRLYGFGIGALPGLAVATWLGLRLDQVPTYDEARKEEQQVLSLKQDDDQGKE